MSEPYTAETGGETAHFDQAKAQAIYEQRARRLSARDDGLPARDSRVPVLVLTLAGERHAIELGKISAVLPAQRIEGVPGSSREVLGILPVQGEVYVVLQLSMLLGLTAEPATVPEAGHVVVLRKQGTRVGLWVESLGNVEPVQLEGDSASGTVEGGIRRSFLKSERAEALVYVDADSIFNHAVFSEEI